MKKKKEKAPVAAAAAAAAACVSSLAWQVYSTLEYMAVESERTTKSQGKYCLPRSPTFFNAFVRNSDNQAKEATALYVHLQDRRVDQQVENYRLLQSRPLPLQMCRRLFIAKELPFPAGFQFTCSLCSHGSGDNRLD